MIRMQSCILCKVNIEGDLSTPLYDANLPELRIAALHVVLVGGRHIATEIHLGGERLAASPGGRHLYSTPGVCILTLLLVP